MKRPATSKLSCVVLAAGLGTRMKSSLPKVLHEIHGKPMLLYCIDALKRLRPDETIVVVGKEHEETRRCIGESFDVTYAVQKKQKGTAHALLSAIPFVKGTTLVTNGDTPLVTPGTLGKFLKRHWKHGNVVSLLSFKADDPASYGRIIRDEKGLPLRIVEEKDASSKERNIKEVNSGVYAMEPGAIEFLKSIRLNRRKGEYYLTDILEIAVRKGATAGVYCIGEEEEFLGVNTMHNLARAQEALRTKTVSRMRAKGVHIIDEGSAHIGPSVNIGAGTTIYPNVYLEGNTSIGKNCTIYPNVRVIDSRAGDNVTVKDSSLIENSVIERSAQVGPFTHIRPESRICESARIGNFVEIKKSTIGKGTKAMHLSYLGDATTMTAQGNTGP
jgi:bifunctional UDP-N-acetylglucosamine pyrophosphorylase/glucosamine-1-phosphate N-acetyltransferase